MKKTVFIVTLLIGGFAFQQASAQVRVSLRVNITSQPVWGPDGYDHVEYYYMPDIDAYYYVPTRQYIYQQRGRWIFATSLPSRFNYNVYTGYKVVVNEPRAYRNAATHRTKYASYKGRRDQGTIRDSREPRYFENRNHPEHNKWKQEQRRKKNNNRRNN
jgi:hypothetical protein